MSILLDAFEKAKAEGYTLGYETFVYNRHRNYCAKCWGAGVRPLAFAEWEAWTEENLRSDKE